MKQIAVIAGPTGSGKNAIVDGVIARTSNCVLMRTTTTRPKRPNDPAEKQYLFLSEGDFFAKVADGSIPEHRYFAPRGTYYGLYKPTLDEDLRADKTILAIVDLTGAHYLKEHYDALTLFIIPQSLEILAERIKKRNPSLTEEEVEARLSLARAEIMEDGPHYDYTISNDEGHLEEAIENVVAILKKEGYNLGEETHV